MFSEADYRYMGLAFRLAESAGSRGEVPIGCVIVKSGLIIGMGSNLCERRKSALNHAEIIALTQAAQVLGGWRLYGCSLYVTLEPCFMCAGAIINSRVSRVVFPLKDARSGAFGSVADLCGYPVCHKPVVEIMGEYEERARGMLSGFFRRRRGASL